MEIILEQVQTQFTSGKLPDQLKQPWLEGLRSGRYEQGKGKLKLSNGSFCCLGVYCEVNGVKISPNGDWMVEENKAMSYAPLSNLIGGEVNKLWRMNDTEGKSFSEIADYIEQNL